MYCTHPVLSPHAVPQPKQVSLSIMAILTHGNYKRRRGWFIVWVNTVPYGHHQLYSKGYQLVSLQALNTKKLYVPILWTWHYPVQEHKSCNNDDVPGAPALSL